MKLRSVLMALALVGVALAGFAPHAAAATCSKSKPVVTDRKGDQEPLYTAESQLDITKADIKYNKTLKGLVFSLNVADLTNSPPTPPATGEWFVIRFTYKGTAYDIVMIGDEVIDGTKRFELGSSTEQGVYDTLNTLKGKYDITKNVVSWNMPFTAFKSGTAKTMGLKATLSAIQISALANHNMVAVTFGNTADEAVAKCNYVVG